jgi:hypothetical protein
LATWNTLKSYIKASYDVDADTGDVVTLTLKTKQGRQQTVQVSRSTTASELEYAIIASLVASVKDVSLAEVLEKLNGYVVGGAVIIDGQIAVRHSVPLQQLDADEFQIPLLMVSRAADALEKELLGTDEQ